MRRRIASNTYGRARLKAALAIALAAGLYSPRALAGDIWAASFNSQGYGVANAPCADCGREPMWGTPVPSRAPSQPGSPGTPGTSPDGSYDSQQAPPSSPSDSSASAQASDAGQSQMNSLASALGGASSAQSVAPS